MKYILPFLFVFSAAFGHKQAYDNLTTIRDKSTRFTDSLISNQIDTVISYYAGSAACPSLPPMSIVYWKHNNVASVVVFKTKTKRRRKGSIDKLGEYHFTPLLAEYNLSYFERNIDRISQDIIRDSANSYVINHTFEEMRVKIGNDSLKYSFNPVNRGYNPTSYKVAFVDNFLSFIHGYMFYYVLLD